MEFPRHLGAILVACLVYTVALGGAATLMCAATGTPTPTITWQKDGFEVCM